MHKESQSCNQRNDFTVDTADKDSNYLNELRSTVVCFYNLYRAVLMHYS